MKIKIKGRIHGRPYHYEASDGGYLLCGDFVRRELGGINSSDLPLAIQVTASTRPFKGGKRIAVRIYYTLRKTPIVLNERGEETSTWLALKTVKFLRCKPKKGDRGQDRVIYFRLESVPL